MNYLKVFKQHFFIRWEIAQNRLTHIILINVVFELVLEELISIIEDIFSLIRSFGFIIEGIFSLIRSFGFIVFTFFAVLIIPLYWIVFIPSIIGVSLYKTLRSMRINRKLSTTKRIGLLGKFEK